MAEMEPRNSTSPPPPAAGEKDKVGGNDDNLFPPPLDSSKKEPRYNKEVKVKRYHALLREFMAHYHGLKGCYPINHEVSEP